MRCVVHMNHAEHQRSQGGWIAEGLRRHGIEVGIGAYDVPEPCDFAVVWGAHQHRIMAAGRSYLMQERGHIQPRMEWTSLGWNGLAGRGLYPQAQDGGERFSRLFGHHLKPWRQGGSYALVMGQTPGDAAVADCDIRAWAAGVCAELVGMGHRVRYRAHPNCAAKESDTVPGVERSTGTLAEDLAGAKFCIVYSSTSCVEAVLAGVPAVTMSIGAMAYPITPHTLAEAGQTQGRSQWCADMAWTQWSEDELRSGAFWEAVRSACPSF
jgi:hypothetical protein